MKELVQQMKHTLHLGTEAAMSANDGDGDLSFTGIILFYLTVIYKNF